jgi:hypothetical protein
MPAALAPRRRAPALSAPAGAFPVSLRVVGADEAARLDRLAARYGGRSAALRAGLLALEACAPLDPEPAPPGAQPVR